ncbi:MAG: response regulator [Phycisphaerae bacterium]
MSARLLIVDDESEIREMLARHFRMLGYDVASAVDGKDALEKLSEKRFDVVVSDIMMPEMNGVELLRAIRADYPMTHVIMITGYVTLENALACLGGGADTCIFKPLTDFQELDDAVSAALATLRRWQRKLQELQGMKPAPVEKAHG